MLVEFSVANFRSIRDRQTLSMVASSAKEHEASNVVLDVAPGVERILKCAVIYGANAAGKSNILLALDVMKELVRTSVKETVKGSRLRIIPFLLDSHASKPTVFEVVFVSESVRYQYGFSAISQRVIEEWLYTYPKKRAQLLFHRKVQADNVGYDWKFGSSLRGAKEVWRNSTRDNSLFLSVAVQLNAEQLLPVFEWFDDSLRVLMSGGLTPNFSKKMLSNPRFKSRMIEFLKSADITFDDISTREGQADQEFIELINEHFPEDDREDLIRAESIEVVWSRTAQNGEKVLFNLADESRGTQKLFGYAAPLIDTLSSGYVLVVDELNNSLHPLLAKNILKMFNDPKQNRSNAQLVVVTHATSMLDLEFLRRDQIWFAEKHEGATQLYPLVDFNPRKDISLAKGYLQGRYGAVPFLSGAAL